MRLLGWQLSSNSVGWYMFWVGGACCWLFIRLRVLFLLICNGAECARFAGSFCADGATSRLVGAGSEKQTIVGMVLTLLVHSFKL
jgi:hypothetical protein